MSLAHVRDGVIKIARSCTSWRNLTEKKRKKRKLRKRIDLALMAGTIHLAWHLHLRTGREIWCSGGNSTNKIRDSSISWKNGISKNSYALMVALLECTQSIYPCSESVVEQLNTLHAAHIQRNRSVLKSIISAVELRGPQYRKELLWEVTEMMRSTSKTLTYIITTEWKLALCKLYDTVYFGLYLKYTLDQYIWNIRRCKNTLPHCVTVYIGGIETQ